MQDSKILVSLVKLVTLFGLLIVGTSVIMMMFLHITYLPKTFNLWIEEVLILISSIVFYYLAMRRRMKIAKIIAIIYIIMSIFNLVGFNFLIKLDIENYKENTSHLVQVK